jgi:hypothetical protein
MLIIKQQPVAGAIPLGADGPQMGEERPEPAKVLEALEGLLRDRRKWGRGHAGLLVTLMSTFLAESNACPQRPLPLATFVPNSIEPHPAGGVSDNARLSEMEQSFAFLRG